MNRFWKWKNVVTEDGHEERSLELYGTIANESWFDDDITPEMFRSELNSGTGPVTVWINSPGGDCIAASRIYTMLSQYPGKVTIKIDGVAASAASVIAMAGDEVLMAPPAMMMIHNPATMAFGDHNDMKAAEKMLDEVKESIINAYEIKTHLPRDEISRMMDRETWMNAKKAMEQGFADGMLESPDKAVDMAAFSFASRSSEDSLKEKLVAKFSKPNSNTGREISALLQKLNSKEESR